MFLSKNHASLSRPGDKRRMSQVTNGLESTCYYFGGSLLWWDGHYLTTLPALGVYLTGLGAPSLVPLIRLVSSSNWLNPLPS